MESLVESAVAVLKANDRGRYTVPSGKLYPHQWAWDSAFAAIGWSTFDVKRGLLELQTLLEGAWPDGRIPHIRFHDLGGDYFPGPAFWGTKDRSSISQPPLWAPAALRLLQRGADEDAVRKLLPAIERSHAWFLQARDPLGWSLVAMAHPWESGMDNSPAWDAALAQVNPEDAPPFQRVDKERVADAEQRPTDAEYQRYAALVAQIAAADFGMGSFAVYDPGFSAILAWADLALSQLAERLEEDAIARSASARAERVRAALIERLYQDGRFGFFDANRSRRATPDVIACFLPLLCGLPADIEQVLKEGLRDRFSTPYPLPTTAPSDPAFDPIRYWRGPSWVNINWLLDECMGGALRGPTLALIESRGFWEYYHPQTGEGLGTDGFTWTAALALDWLQG